MSSAISTTRTKALAALAIAAGVGHIGWAETSRQQQAYRIEPPKPGKPGNSLTKARAKAKARRKAQQAARRRT